MMETISLLPGVTLRCFRDRRFKQACLSVQLVRPMAAQEASCNALLPAVLLRGTRSLPDMRAITRRLDQLYGASVSTLVRRVGDYQTTGLYASFMEDRFALPGDRVLEEMTGLLGELFLDSRLEAEAFLPEFVDSEKQNLIATIEAERNDKRVYAMGRLLKNMCREDTFGLSRLGEPEQIAAITPGSLYDHYQKILATSPIHVFYVGSAPAEQVASLLRPVFGGLSRQSITLPEQSPLRPGPGGDHREKMDVTQGKLCMGFVTPITNRCPEFAAMQVLNTIFGAGMTSKLFQNLRETMSLCYSVGSSYYGSKGIVTVAAGIDFDKEELSRREILRQLELCCQGSITQEELTAAREALHSSLRATHDSPGAIEGYYATTALSGMGWDPEEYSAAVDRVTLEQVTAAAKTLKLHTTYFLEGGSQ